MGQVEPSARGGQQSWVSIYRRLDVMYAGDNVDLPTLNPWVGTTASPAQRFVYLRNPYYHRIDEKGQQLPYVDRIIFTVAATSSAVGLSIPPAAATAPVESIVPPSHAPART